MDAATLQALIAAAQSGTHTLISPHVLSWNPT